MTEDQAIKIDLILNLLISQDSGTQYPVFYADGIRLKTEFSIDEVFDLIDKIELITHLENPIVVIKIQRIPTVGNFKFIRGCYNTEQFLTDGGCIQYYHNEKIREAKEKELKQLEKQKLLNDLASFKITKKQFLWTVSMAIAGFLLALFSLILQIFQKYI